MICDGTDFKLCKTGATCCGSGPVLYWYGSEESQTFKDKYIPLILGAIGIVLCAIWVLGTSPLNTGQDIAMAIFTAVVQGILVAGLSTYINQVVKQSNKVE